MQRSKAFTLIELLVVIAIIAILAAILFPVFAQAKKAAKKTQCLSNIKQMATAVVMYGSDFDDMSPANGEGYYPSSTWGGWTTLTPFTGQTDFAGSSAGYGKPLGFMDPTAIQNWGAELYPYIKSMGLYTCVSTQNDLDPNKAPVPNNSNAGRTSYVFNGCGSAKSLTAMSRPADFITFQGRGTTVREAVTFPRMNGFPDGTTKANDSDSAQIGFTHDMGDNYAMADGHAKFKKRSAVTFKELGFWEWVNVHDKWIDPNTNPTMTADPTKNPAVDNWGSWGNCDPAQVP